MKKTTFVKAIIITLALVAGYIGYEVAQDHKTVTDEEIVEAYIIGEHGDGNYEIDIYDKDDEFVYYMVYEDGDCKWCCSTNIDYMTRLYESDR